VSNAGNTASEKCVRCGESMETVFALETHLVERHGLSPSDAATESLAVELLGALIDRNAEVERLRKALDTISRMTRIADPEVHEIAKEALGDV
jgi:hypothetical protein